MRTYRLIAALACLLGVGVVAALRTVTLRATLNGFPSLTLPERVPPGGKQADLFSWDDSTRSTTLAEWSERGIVWVWQPIPADPARWEGFDSLLDELTQHDMRLIAALPSDSITAAAFAERYGAQVDVYHPAQTSQAIYEAIHAADEGAEVLTGTLRTVGELRAVYNEGLPFDAAAVSLSQMTLHPDARWTRPNVYGLADVTRIRQVMVRNQDEDKRVWLVGLSGEQDARTTYERILYEWPWAGAIIAAPEAAPPAGLPLDSALWPGLYGVGHPLVSYEGEWEFREGAADFSEFNESIARLPFKGDSLGAVIQRGDYRAYLYVSVDGAPAQGLPTEYITDDDLGRDGAYAVLTSPDYQPALEIIPLASGYDRGTVHQAMLAAERGWDQFALRGYAVGNYVQTWPYDAAVGGLLLAAVWALWPAAATVMSKARRSVTRPLQRLYATFPRSVARRLAAEVPERTWLLALTATALVLSVSPGVLITMPALLVLTALLFLRPQYGPALLLLSAPFYRLPRPFLGWQFSTVELVSLVLIGVWGLHMLLRGVPSLTELWVKSHTLDKAVTVFVGIAALSLVWSPLLGVAVTELRTMVFEPLVAYLVLRTLPFTAEERWRTVDALMLAGGLVALIGIGQFAVDLVRVGGFVCLRSTLGTCNNAALFMGRIIPIGVAVALLSDEHMRRRAYGGLALLMLAATVLTTSRGGLLLGIPAGVGLVVIMWGGRKAAVAVAAVIVAQFAALIPLARLVPRFNLLSQSNLFRVQLWQSTLRMLQDRPLTGWGLDQFLYAYRGRYILPAAWQQPDLSQPHNLFLNYWVRLGVLGLAAGVWLQVAFWRMIWRTQRRLKWFAPRPPRALAIGLMGCMAAFVAHGMVDATHFVIDLAFILFAILGLTHQLHQEAHHAEDR
jgi:O-antigen ligase